MSAPDPKILKHGSLRDPELTMPIFGHSVSTPKVTIAVAPSMPYEVSFVPETDLTTLFFGAFDADYRLGTDRMQSDWLNPFFMHFNPAGFHVYSRSTVPMGGLLQVATALSFRKSLDADFDAPKPSGIDRTAFNLQSEKSVGLTRMALRLASSQIKPDSISIETLGLMILSEAVRVALRRDRLDRRPVIGLDVRRLSQVTELIEERLDTDLSLDDLAESLGLSVFHFAKSFKVAMGLTPRQYVIERRIARAKTFLKRQSYPWPRSPMPLVFHRNLT